MACALVSNAQTLNTRPAPTKNASFLTFAEKVKQLPPNSPAAKMKASGISFTLSSAKMVRDDNSYLEYEKPDMVWNNQAGFSQNSMKDGFGGPTLLLVSHEKENIVCLVEMNLWLPGSTTPHEFHVGNYKNMQTIKIEAKGTAYYDKKLVFTVILAPGLHKIRVYNSTHNWNFLNCQITYLN